MTEMTQLNAKKNESEFFRFQLFQGRPSAGGKVERTKTVGMAYLKEGQENYTLRLWTFVEARFFLRADRKQADHYFLMTREPTKSPTAKNKYFWNIVGSGRALTTAGVIELRFDLFEQPIYMNLFPEAQAHSASFADFEDVLGAA